MIFGRSRAASPSISTAPSPSCPARRSTSARSATSRPLMDIPQPFQILKMDRRRGNIVVSRRAILEETRAEQRSGLIQSLAEGQVIDGVVKNITDYGAFVDLGGIDGLLHVTDIAWRRVNHPSEVLNIGDTVKVQIIRINHETQRISLGMKQLESDPWEGVAAKYPVGARVHRPRHQHHRIWRLRRAGAGHRRPGPRLRNELDQEERPPGQDRLAPRRKSKSWCSRSTRTSAASRSASSRPGAIRGKPSPRSTRSAPTVEGEVKNATEFGLFIGLDGDVDGMVHMSDIAWGCPGEEALDDFKQGRDGQGRGARRRRREGAHLARHEAARQATPAPSRATSRRARSSPAKCSKSTTAASKCRSGHRRHRLHQAHRSWPRPRRAASGAFPGRPEGRRPRDPVRQEARSISIKALEIAEEKEAVAQYGSSDSGASLGDILGAALKNRDK